MKSRLIPNMSSEFLTQTKIAPKRFITPWKIQNLMEEEDCTSICILIPKLIKLMYSNI